MSLKFSLDKHLTWETCFLLVRRLMNCMASSMESDSQWVGGLVPSLLFLTLWPRPRTPQYMIQGLRSSWYLCWLILSIETETKCCFTPSDPLRSTSAGLSSISLPFLIYLSQWPEEGNGCPKTLSCFGLDWLLTIGMGQAVKVEAYKVWKIGTSLLFKRNCVIQQYLRCAPGLHKWHFQPSS